MKKANPVVIGSFVIGAIILLIIGIMVFSSGKLFTRTHTMVAVFPGAVKGLQVGNSVEFRGVRIGSVKEIKVLYDSETSSVVVPVYMEIVPETMMGTDLQKLQATGSDEKWRTEINSLIKAGFRAQLDMQSVVTGQMVVALDFQPGTSAKLVGVDERYPEIPTRPSIITTLLDTLQKLPMEELLAKLVGTIDGINDLVHSQEIVDILNNANLATQDVRKLLARVSDQVQPLSDSTRATLNEAQQTIAALEKQLSRTLDQASTLLQDVDNKVNPLSKSATTAMNAAGTAFKSVDDLVNRDSVIRADLESTLKEIAAAAHSLRILTDYLERHPDSLIKGKGY